MSHYPGHLREAFYNWLDQGQPPYAMVEVRYEPTNWTPEALLGRMHHCTDVMPSGVCDQQGVPKGTTCAGLAQRLLRERPSERVQPAAAINAHAREISALREVSADVTTRRRTVDDALRRRGLLDDAT